MCYAAIAMVAIAAIGAYQQAATQKAQANYQSQVATNNSKVAEWQAEDAKARGDKASQDMRRKYAGLMGTQRAALAARGLDISEGSANATLQDTAFFGEVDEQTVRANAAREAWGYRVRASNFQGDAAALGATANATNPLLSAGMAAGGTLFQGGDGSVAAKWYRGNQGGGGGGGAWQGMGGNSSDPWYG